MHVGHAPVAPKSLASAGPPLSDSRVPRPPAPPLFLGSVLGDRRQFDSRREVDVDALVREVRAKELVVIFDERERCRQDALKTLTTLAQQHPKVSEVPWIYVRKELDFDAAEIALTKYYASHFTSDELTHVAKLFEPAEMRGLITAVWLLAQRPPTAEALPAEMEEFRKRFGPGPIAKLGDLLNSALGRQLVAAQKSAEEIRRKEIIAALVADETRVRARR